MSDVVVRNVFEFFVLNVQVCFLFVNVGMKDVMFILFVRLMSEIVFLLDVFLIIVDFFLCNFDWFFILEYFKVVVYVVMVFFSVLSEVIIVLFEVFMCYVSDYFRVEVVVVDVVVRVYVDVQEVDWFDCKFYVWVCVCEIMDIFFDFDDFMMCECLILDVCGFF